MIEKKRKSPTYSGEFKAEAIRKSRESSINQTSKDLGVSIAALRNWFGKAEVGLTEKGKPSYEDLEKKQISTEADGGKNRNLKICKIEPLVFFLE